MKIYNKFNSKVVTDNNFHAFITTTSTNSTLEIPVSSIEVSEEDLRVKSCKIKTTRKVDITEAMWYFYVTYQGYLVFGGVILDNEYDETTGVYSYQLQGFQRWLTSKTYFVHNPKESDKNNLYKALSDFCNRIKTELKYIRDVKFYSQKSYEPYPNNKVDWKSTDGLFYEDKTYYEILQSLVAESNCAIDCYVDEDSILHLDPINLNTWQSDKSIYLTTDNLSAYTYQNDATNIVTNVIVKTTDIYKQHKLTAPKTYTSSDLLSVDLNVYFGDLSVFLDSSNSDSKSGEEVQNKTAQAREKITEHIRDLMSFEIEYNGFLPQLHTNMWMWFEMPKQHILANYSKFVANIDKTTTRGGKYVLNRFYVEKIETTYDENGVKQKITLNPFASDMSSYTDLYKSAKEDYEKANCTSSGNGSSGSNAGTVTDGNIGSGKKYAVGIDYGSGHGDAKILSNICNALKKGGATVKSLGVGSNKVQNFGLSSSSKGYTAIFIANGVGLGTPSDMYVGIVKQGHYHYNDCIFVFPQWIGNNLMSDNNIKNRTVHASAESDIGFISGGSMTVEKWFRNHKSMALVADKTPQGVANKILSQSFTASPKGTNYDSGSSIQNSSASSGNCVSSANNGALGSYNVPKEVQLLANKLTSSQDEVTICKQIQKMKSRGFIGYNCYSGFCREPAKVVRMGSSNCCDGTRLQLNMCAFKGVKTANLHYIHTTNHVYGMYQSTRMDWLGGGSWGHNWGASVINKKTTFPTQPFNGACINSCGGLELLEENGYSSFDEKLNETILEDNKDTIIMCLDDANDFEDKYGYLRLR